MRPDLDYLAREIESSTDIETLRGHAEAAVSEARRLTRVDACLAKDKETQR